MVYIYIKSYIYSAALKNKFNYKYIIIKYYNKINIIEIVMQKNGNREIENLQLNSY